MLRGAVVFVAWSVATASADNYQPPPPPPAPPVTTLDPDKGPKNPLLALVLSAGATAVPILAASAVFRDDDHDGQYPDALWWISAGAVLVGPSVGHWYAGKPFTIGLAARAGGFALGTIAVVDREHEDDGLGMLLLGAACIVGGTIYDLATAGNSARDYNHEHATRVMPVVAPAIAPDGSTQLRVGLTGSF